MSGGERLLHLAFAAEPAALKGVRDAVTQALACCCACEGWTRDVVLAVDEACQNIIRHAYGGQGGPVDLELWRQDGRLVVRLVDWARPVDPGTIHPRALDDVRPGGLGTHFMRAIMDEVAFLPPPAGAGNLLQMVKTIG